MLGGAYSNQFKNVERQQLDTIKTFAENDKMDQIARAKKLSLETNKRRRALALKRKNDAAREEKRRQQILTKRREKQKEATERFQRANMPPRPASGTSSNASRWSPRHTTQLEDALRLVRGSPTASRAGSARTQDRASPTRTSYYRQNSDPLSKPYFNKYAHPSINQGQNGIDRREELHNKSLHNLNASRNLFEKQLEAQQQMLLEQQQNALKEFNKQLMKEVEYDTHVEQNDGIERSESLSSVDSLEETASNDTLRESVDLRTFENSSNTVRTDAGSNGIAYYVNGQDKVVGANPSTGNQFNSSSNTPQNIESYNTQVQSVTNGGQFNNGQGRNQQTYQHRQFEIQQQILEQRQQHFLQQEKQQQELQQRIQQQQKQQQLLQQEFQKQQEHLQNEKQLDKNLQSNSSSNSLRNNGNENEKENNRPKVQLKAWATPSPQPPTPISSNISSHNLVTNSSPYSGRSTNTAMTTVTTYDNSVIKTGNTNVNSKNAPDQLPVSQNGVSQPSSFSNMGTQETQYHINTVGHQPQTVQNKGLESQGSFLDTVTKDLTKQQSYFTVVSDNQTKTSGVVNNTTSTIPNTGSSQKSANQQTVKKSANEQTTKNGTGSLNSPTATSVVSKPPVNPGFYLNSYSSQHVVRQNLQQQKQQQQQPKTRVQEPATPGPVTTVDASRLNMRPTVGSQPVMENQILFQTDGMFGDEGQDTADTDSVSTIACDEREPEPKEVKSILKRGGSAKGILKKSNSAGNIHNRNEIRDSLEITRVHLQTSAEEKEQRMLREAERRRPQCVVKKSVRFADLTYDEPEETQAGENELFVRRTQGKGQSSSSQSRPVSAKAIPAKVDHKPPRASSATVRASSIPRTKTQIVRPTAAAHIIQSPPSVNSGYTGEQKVTIVNSNFMEKVPSMSRQSTQPLHTASPSMVYSMASRPDQKVNYAVSSIIMPKTNSAPFIYPNNSTKEALQPSASSSMPAQNVTNSKYEGAVYDDNGLRIDRTPTDDEINFLWDKVRTCLSRNSTPGEKVQTSSSTAQESHRQAAPVANTYIDGNALGQFNSMNRVAAPNYGSSSSAIQRQNSLDSANGSYTKRYGLLQQRKQQANPNSLKTRQQGQGQGQTQGPQGYTVYHAPVQSYNEPTQTGQHNGDVSESMAEFLTAEQLAEQSVSESRIHQAMDDAYTRQQNHIAGKPPPPKGKSALSMEEQRLLESLDRLNDKLKVDHNVAPVSNQPQSNGQHQQTPQQMLHRSSFLTPEGKVGGFKGHQPIHSQRRVIEGANPRARLRITSATLKKHIHRHQ